MYKCVIFDLDGTLIDSAGDICLFINKTMAHYGYPKVAKSDVIKFIGNGARNLVIKCIGKPETDEKIDEVLAYYNNVYATSKSQLTEPFDGVIELLKALKGQGFKLAILSNKPHRNTTDLYNQFFSEFKFDAVVGQSGTVKCKPDKTATLNLLKEIGVEPENAYFVGDGETDVQTSINAGTNGIAVLWGYRDKRALSLAGAKIFASTPQDIISIINC